MLISNLAWFNFALAVAVSSVPTTQAASFELISREVTGHGDSKDAAVVNALVEAVRQFHGLSIESEKKLRIALVETDTKRELGVSLVEQINSTTSGRIQSYEVLAVTQQGVGWSAQLLVRLPRYDSPGPDRAHLRTIAVLPLRVKNRSDLELSRRWEQKVVTHLVQSRRFRLIDREFYAELDSEEARLRSGNTPVTELVRLGQQLGADYVLAGEITHFAVNSDAGSGAVTDASLTTEYRVIELAPREVRWANTVSGFLSRDALQRLGIRNDRNQIRENLLDFSADSAVTEILNVIYPIKVLGVEQDGTVLLTQGGVRNRPGRWFSISSGDMTINDPDTGLEIRVDGRELGIATVVKVHPKYSEAKLESGELASIQPGMICRPFDNERISAVQRQAQEERVRIQQDRIADGRCPPLVVRSFRTRAGWSIVARNTSDKPIRISELTKHIGGATDQSSFSLDLRARAEETFGLPYAFGTGDALEIICDGFEEHYRFYFP